MADPEILLSLSGCDVRLGRATVLSGVDLGLRAGEHLAVLGGNGAGKSTLLRLLLGEVHPAQSADPATGRILAGRRAVRPAARPILLVSAEQQDAYLRRGADLTGLEVACTGPLGVFLPYRDFTESELAAGREALEAAAAGHLAGRSAAAMSRGELRRLLVARALAARPGVLLLDEALDGLDRASRSDVLAALEAAARAGTTLAVSAHRAADLPPCVAEAVLLEQGRIIARGAPLQLLPQAPDAPAEASAPRRPAGPPPAFLARMERACVVRGGRTVLEDLDWTIEPGQAWAVLGDNGAGKSTLISLLTAELWPQPGGRVSWFGRTGPRDVWEVRRDLGLISPELQAGYAYDAPALDLVLSGFSWSMGLYGEPTPEQAAAGRRAMLRAGLAGLEERPIRSLSYGQLRRLLVARALAHEPRLLLLDEAASGLDAPARAGLLDTLDRLFAAGTGLVCVAHRPDDLPSCLTHALVLEAGRAAYRGPVAGLPGRWR
ncbi:MAG: ATP-binding cassette domain-containing protein [Thermodesulfobacteriota bacterium]